MQGLSTRRLKVISALALACFAVFITYAVLRASRAGAPSTTFPAATLPVIHRNTPAPAFALHRLGGGAPVTLAGLRGRPAVVNFFASWCPNCRAELAAFAKVAHRSAGAVAFVGIDTNDSNAGLAEQLLRQAGATYPVGVDPNGNIAVHYLVNNLPVTFFLNPRGQVVGELFGRQSVASLTRAVADLTAPAVPR